MSQVLRSIACAAGFALLSAPAAAQIVEMDGQVNEWPDGALAIADGRAVYFRLSLDNVTSLQSSAFQTSLLIDVDGDPASGAMDVPGAGGLGVDLEFQMSPHERDGIGLMAMQYGDGGAVQLGAGAHRFMWAPTYASDTFEFRMTGLPAHEHVRARFVGVDLLGDVIWSTDAFGLTRIESPPDPTLPEVSKPEGALRIVSMNVLWGSPDENPEALARIFRTLDPDVLLLQEWEDSDFDKPVKTADEIRAWFAAADQSWADWDVVKSDARGVAVVSRHALQEVPTADLVPDAAGDEDVRTDRGIRIAAARVNTGESEFLVASLHLKCCGALGGYEDAQRMAEARAIRAALKAESRRAPVSAIMVGGDFNLVGVREPLTILAEGLDLDGSEMEVADTVNTGARHRVTWREGDSRFPPGRLDFALYSGASAEVLQSFVLDTSLLDDEVIESIGLKPDDLKISDHLPVVVDLIPKR